VARARLQRTRARLHASDEFAIASHQLTAVKHPGSPIRALVASQTGSAVDVPHSLWRDDPEIARALNHRLVRRSD